MGELVAAVAWEGGKKEVCPKGSIVQAAAETVPGRGRECSFRWVGESPTVKTSGGNRTILTWS